MAQVSFAKPPKPIEISKFLGINESVGQTEIEVGEAVLSENFRITKNFKPQKRPGHHTFIDFGSVQDVQGVWYGQIASKEIMLVCWNGNVYEYDMTVDTDTTDIADLITELTVTIIGTLTDARTSIFWFEGKIYFLNGTDYKEYDGTTYQDVTPYVPTVVIGTPPAGGGTLFEEINLLTGEKSQQFIGDNASTLYQLAETNIDVDTVLCTVDGVTKTEGVDFTVNRTLGQVTFTIAPITDAIVIITWHKDVAGNPDLVKNHKYAIDFGASNDTNLFIWGNENEKHRFRFSATLEPGYFPVNSFVSCGSDEFAITSLKPQYQSLLVFKQNETKIVRPELNPLFDTNPGLNLFNYPYFDLNEAVGNIASNMVQLIENNPMTLDGFSMWLWASDTGVEDERNAKIVSDRIKLSLEELNLSTAVTFDWQNQKEYWLNIGGVVYIWNYGNDTFYKYTNFDATAYIDVNGIPYYGSESGTVEKISSDFTADGSVLGTNIPCKMKLGFTDFESLELRKSMWSEWVAISPAARTSLDIKFVTDRKNEEESKTFSVKYSFFDFGNIDFSDFDFSTNKNPQPERLRGKIKKFTWLQVIFENNSNDETLTILKLLLQAQSQGFSR